MAVSERLAQRERESPVDDDLASPIPEALQRLQERALENAPKDTLDQLRRFKTSRKKEAWLKHVVRVYARKL